MVAIRNRSILCAGVLLSSVLAMTHLFAGGFHNGSAWCEPVNLGPPINSEFNDAHAAISSDGLTLYFVTNRPEGFGGEDIWVSRRASLEDPWPEPQNLGSNINTANNDLAPSLSPDGHWMFFASNRPGCGGVDLWASWRWDPNDDNAWEPSVNLGCVVNSVAADSGPSYHEDHRTRVITLYFASNRPGVGSFDIYASTLGQDGSWNPPVVVTEISSQQWDAGPDVRFNGRELFFQSNRPGSLDGRLDLWVSTRKKSWYPWTTPINLGPAVNSEHVEHGPSLTVDGMALYFDSDRPDGLGGTDIYVTTRKRLQ